MQLVKTFSKAKVERLLAVLWGLVFFVKEVPRHAHERIVGPVENVILILPQVEFASVEVHFPAGLVIFVFVIGDGGRIAVMVRIIFFATFFGGHGDQVTIRILAEVVV